MGKQDDQVQLTLKHYRKRLDNISTEDIVFKQRFFEIRQSRRVTDSLTQHEANENSLK